MVYTCDLVPTAWAWANLRNVERGITTGRILTANDGPAFYGCTGAHTLLIGRILEPEAMNVVGRTGRVIGRVVSYNGHGKAFIEV